MARIRTIKPEFPHSESMGRVSRKAITAEERRQVATRYGCAEGSTAEARCIYCGTIGTIHWLRQTRGKGWVQFDGLELDHKHPVHQGGLGGDNLDVACRPCNRAKGPRTEDQWVGA
jgi:5-methylcytosine-specific restriction endonuclease McrA